MRNQNHWGFKIWLYKQFSYALLYWAFFWCLCCVKVFAWQGSWLFCFPRIIKLSYLVLYSWQNVLVLYFIFFLFLTESFPFSLSVFRKCWQVRGFVSLAPTTMLSWQLWTNKEVMAFFVILPLLLKSRNSMHIKQSWQPAVTTSE